MGNDHKGAHHRGSHDRRAQAVRDTANADPTTTCRRCGLTLAEKRLEKPNDTWDAGHLNDGQVNGPLVPEHASCNRSAGARLGNRRRRGFRTSRDW